MAVGDVEVRIVKSTTTLIDAAITAMRTTANDKWLMASIQNGQNMVIANIEEAA
jgi:hypothetical protein